MEEPVYIASICIALDSIASHLGSNLPGATWGQHSLFLLHHFGNRHKCDFKSLGRPVFGVWGLEFTVFLGCGL